MNHTSEIERDLLVSLHGVEVWRQYRVNGMLRALLLDLYGDPTRNYEQLLARMFEIVTLFLNSPAHTDMVGLVARVQQRVATLPKPLQLAFERHYFLVHREFHDTFYPGFQDDDYFYTTDFAWVKKWLTIIINPDEDSDPALRAMVTPLWFEMCDVAAGA